MLYIHYYIITHYQNDIKITIVIAYMPYFSTLICIIIIIIIIIIHEFHRDASLEQNFRAAVCHVLHKCRWPIVCVAV